MGFELGTEPEFHSTSRPSCTLPFVPLFPIYFLRPHPSLPPLLRNPTFSSLAPSLSTPFPLPSQESCVNTLKGELQAMQFAMSADGREEEERKLLSEKQVLISHRHGVTSMVLIEYALYITFSMHNCTL